MSKKFNYSDAFNPKETPQTKPIRKDQVKNNQGGYVWKVEDSVLLDRFILLGTEQSTYYQDAKDLTIQAAEATIRCIQADPIKVVDRVVEISNAGRAAKNDPALFVLALCASSDSEGGRYYALTRLNEVARTATHLFTFVEYVQSFRGWGRGLRTAVGNWYNDKTVENVAYQVVKYRNRNGWTHRDVLRLAHPDPETEQHSMLYKWIISDTVNDAVESIPVIKGFLKAQQATKVSEIVSLIREYNLPRETIPTMFLKEAKVWEALLEKMPLMAMIRNLGVMGSVNLLVPGAWGTIETITERLNEKALHKAMIHPMQVLTALYTYKSGHGLRGSNTWSVVPQIVDALEDAFYRSFATVEPSNKRFMVSLDVSASMTWKDLNDIPGFTPRVASAVMAMVTVRSEPKHAITGFSDHLVDIPITAKSSLHEVIRVIDNLPYGGTDCSLPMIHALNNGMSIDQFIIYTDSETGHGIIHPVQALNKYRQATGINAKLAVVAMEPNNFSIADPTDPGMMDFVGFDANTPQAISVFAGI